jgi:hypothetical protein
LLLQGRPRLPNNLLLRLAAGFVARLLLLRNPLRRLWMLPQREEEVARFLLNLSASLPELQVGQELARSSVLHHRAEVRRIWKRWEFE